MSHKSNVAKMFDAILEDIKNNKNVTELISVTSRGKNINLKMRKKQCSKEIMDLMKHLKFLME